MKSKKEMAKQKSAKAPVAALDVSAYFSEEEWKLLHEWQKELYRNVMKEIHQALISLGPLIATSVCSLRAKENEDVFAVDLRDSERRQQTNCSTSVPPLNSDNDFRAEGEWDVSSEDDHSSGGGENSIVPSSCHEASIQILSFSIKEEPDAYPMVHQDSQKKQNINYATEFPLPRPEDSPKGGGSILDHSSTEDAVIPPVVSFSIKNEGDAYSVNHQNSERNESISNSVCDPGIKSVLSVNVIHNEETHFTNEQYPEGKTTGISTSVNPTEQQQANSWEKMYTTSEYGNSVSHTLDVANNHLIYPEENAHACTEYGSGFNQSKNIGVHQRTDTRLRPYTWNECVKNDPSTLSPHEKIHTGLKLCTCSQCGKYFSQTANEITYPQMNNRELLNTCTECKKNFSHSENLNIEMRGRLYVCSECGKGFRQSQSLTNHLRLHTGEKPYSCRECGKSFRQSQTLTTHQRIHTGEKPYICCECGKCFSDMANLIRHRRIHTGERPYQCPVCDKRFNRHGHLIRHKRSHTVAIRK